jgi:hypothetical protein
MHRFTTALLAFSLSAAVVAQATPEPQALPGQLDGTKRYNVTFKTRTFDLAEFQRAVRTGASASEVDRIVASLQAKARQDQLPFQREIEALGGRLVLQFWLINACTIELAPARLAVVEAMPNVAFVHPDLETHPIAPILVATNANNHNADAPQAAGHRGTGVGVAIVDTGQDSNMGGSGRPHMTYFRNGNPTDTTGGGIGGSLLFTNRQLGAAPADDTNGHGTGVLGIAGGNRWNNGSGDNGHAFDAIKLGYSICNSAGGCGSSLAIEALGWQAAAGDKVRYNIASGNMSYTSSPNPLDVSQQAIDACATLADLLPVTAAANSGASTGTSSSTANGLAVAAVTGNTKTVASFSSRGPLSGDTQRFFPDIAANGVNTIMPARDNEAGNYTASGTSMASPQVCGAAALIKGSRPTLSALELKAVLLCHTESIAAQNPNPPYNSRNAYGMGYLRDDLTVAAALSPGKVVSDAIASTTTPRSFVIVVGNGQPVSVALSWHRHNLTSTAWSNLGIKVLNGTNVVASNDDPRNLYEVVRFTAPLSGPLTVEVSATSLEIASVPFALASTHAFAGVAAHYEMAGAACPGAGGYPTLVVKDDPVVGAPFVLGLAFARTTTPAVLAFGANAVSINLGPIGAPLCSQLASMDILLPIMTDGQGTASLTVTVPNNPALLGGAFHNQGVIADNGANLLGIVTTQRGSGTIGSF